MSIRDRIENQIKWQQKPPPDDHFSPLVPLTSLPWTPGNVIHSRFSIPPLLFSSLLLLLDSKVLNWTELNLFIQPSRVEISSFSLYFYPFFYKNFFYLVTIYKHKYIKAQQRGQVELKISVTVSGKAVHSADSCLVHGLALLFFSSFSRNVSLSLSFFFFSRTSHKVMLNHGFPFLSLNIASFQIFKISNFKPFLFGVVSF